jgi:5-methylcytosine-specific restriction protein A
MARNKCIEHYGYKCQICGIEMENIYGDIGKEFIHVHHLNHISDYGGKHKVDPIKDLITVCPNCHAMLHKKIDNEYVTFEYLKNIFKGNP